MILFLMQTSKKIPFDDPNVLNGIRGFYILSNIIIAGIYLYVQQQINKKNGSFWDINHCISTFFPRFQLTYI